MDKVKNIINKLKEFIPEKTVNDIKKEKAESIFDELDADSVQ